MPSATQTFSRIFNSANGQGNDLILVGRYSTTPDTLFVQDYNGTTPARRSLWRHSDLNRWTHIAVTITQSGSVLVYKNGRIVGSGPERCSPQRHRTSTLLARAIIHPMRSLPAASMKRPSMTRSSPPTASATHFYTHGQGALLNRGNNSTGRNVIELTSATDVTIKKSPAHRRESGASMPSMPIGSSFRTILRSQRLYRFLCQH